jgi:cystathionine beta-lyase/cystathionine gamma-synthase
MKDKTMAIGLWIALALLAASIVLHFATDLFGGTEDVIIQNVKRTENY